MYTWACLTYIWRRSEIREFFLNKEHLKMPRSKKCTHKIILTHLFSPSLFFQPLRLDIKRRLTARSDRVKCVDLHPTEPWMVASLYNGNVHVWNYENQTLVKSFEVCDLPVRATKFVPRKNWIVTGSDDMLLRVFNYNTLGRTERRRQTHVSNTERAN